MPDFAGREGAWRDDVVRWLRTLLGRLFAGWSSEVFDTSKLTQADFLGGMRLYKAFPMLETFEIRVDVTGIMRRKDRALLALVDCKTGPISLKDVGPLLAYSRVASPAFGLIVSPSGVSNALRSLLRNRKGMSLLEYGHRGALKIAKWDLQQGRVDFRSVVPRGVLR